MISIEEYALDNLRHFAESSDSIEAIDLFFDLNCDLGIMSEHILEAIRVDYGPSVTIPLWVVERVDHEMAKGSMLAPSKSRTLQSLTNPLALARFTEYCDLLIPLDGESINMTDHMSDIQVPFGIATMYSFRSGGQAQQQQLSTRQWVDECTYRKTFPICGLESACFSTDERLPKVDDFFTTTTGSRGDTRDRGSQNQTESLKRNRHDIPLNPMMVRRSPYSTTLASNNNNNSSNINNTIGALANVALTNFTVFKGWNDPYLSRKLYDYVRNGNYFMSQCMSYDTPWSGEFVRYAHR
jgi:hypothetical protein